MNWIRRQYARYFADAQKHPMRIIVCGGGASAVLFVYALNKFGKTPLDVTIVEQKAHAGPGLAYDTQYESHLLNVPALAMAVDSENPTHFVRWLNTKAPTRQGGYGEGDFVSRQLYGEYLRDVLAQIATKCVSGLRVSIMRTTALGAKMHGDTWCVSLSNGAKLKGDLLVLATGNEPPNSIIAKAPQKAHRFIVEDPWNVAAKQAIPKHDTVLIVGSGLTAVDTSIELLESCHTGSIICASRHALLPHTHSASSEAQRMTIPYPKALGDILIRFRDIAGCADKEAGWQGAIEAMRPFTPDLWRSLPLVEQRRFLRHLKSYWNAHRHRVAPEIGSQILQAVSRGRLALVRGRIKALQLGTFGKNLRVTLQTGGSEHDLLVDRVINCTGPNEDITRAKNRLLVDLMNRGLVQPDQLQLGLEVDEHSRAVSKDGRIHLNLFALGGLTKGRWWEITAVPEIRAQAERIGEFVACLSLSQGYSTA